MYAATYRGQGSTAATTMTQGHVRKDMRSRNVRIIWSRLTFAATGARLRRCQGARCFTRVRVGRAVRAHFRSQVKMLPLPVLLCCTGRDELRPLLLRTHWPSKQTGRVDGRRLLGEAGIRARYGDHLRTERPLWP